LHSERKIKEERMNPADRIDRASIFNPRRKRAPKCDSTF
jgi:hypothetical protein